MTTSVYVQRVCALLLASGALTACSDSTPIGSIECIGERIRCGVTAAQDEDVSQISPLHDLVSSTGLEILMPASTTQPFSDTPERRVSLTADVNGDLWSVGSHGSRVVLAKLDRDGSTVEEHAIEPPRGTRKPSDLQVVAELVAASSTNSKATLRVHWSHTCDWGGDDPFECQFDELLVFDDFAEAPRRIDTKNDDPTHVQANESGEWLMYALNAPRFDKLDEHSNLVWRQTGSFTRDWQQGLVSIRGVLRANNQLSALLSFGQGVPLGLELWLLNSTGDVATRRHIGSGDFYPEYAIDARGRDVIAGTTLEGDLMFMRVLGGVRSEGSVITREEFSSLRPVGLAVDSAGAAYVATTAGGREQNEQRTVLCQLPDVGQVRCFTLDDESDFAPMPLIDQLVVPEPGVVYVRSGSDLRRYELPEE